MPCYHPIPAWRKERSEDTGKRGISFAPTPGNQIEIPCGRCIGCRIERSRQWAVRCLHESKSWEVNSFVTLTYNRENLPSNGSLVPEDFSKFIRALRDRWRHFERPPIRFFACGEYGGKLGRPHYHALLFNCHFSDRRYLKKVRGNKLWVSKELDDLWGKGFCTIGSVTFQSAGYIARYTLKKINGPSAAAHYGDKVPEFLRMSLKPGIGGAFIEKFADETFRDDACIVAGQRVKVPRYYDTYLERVNPALAAKVRLERKLAGAGNPDSTGSRLIVRETVKQAAVKMLTREFEDN